MSMQQWEETLYDDMRAQAQFTPGLGPNRMLVPVLSRLLSGRLAPQ